MVNRNGDGHFQCKGSNYYFRDFLEEQGNGSMSELAPRSTVMLKDQAIKKGEKLKPKAENQILIFV